MVAARRDAGLFRGTRHPGRRPLRAVPHGRGDRAGALLGPIIRCESHLSVVTAAAGCWPHRSRVAPLRGAGDSPGDPAGGRAVPGRPLPALPPAAGLARVRPGSSTPSPRVGGWVGGTTGSSGCVDGRPRLSGTPVLDEPVPAGCARTIRWSRPHTHHGLGESPGALRGTDPHRPRARHRATAARTTRTPCPATAPSSRRSVDAAIRDHRKGAWTPGRDGLVHKALGSR
jgi:hypothetical protein